MTHAYIFFSVHEQLFDRVAQGLAAANGVTRFSGFVWGRDQQHFLEVSSIRYDPLIVFTRDVLPASAKDDLDMQYLARCEENYGVSIQRMIAAERHLTRYGYDRLLRI